MSLNQKKDWREERRYQGWKLYKRGWSQKVIAEALGVTKGAVSQWIKKAQKKGEEALKKVKPPGRPPRLSEEELAKLPDLLAKGASHYGYRGEVWTRNRVRRVLRGEFQKDFHETHVGRILKKIGWSYQKPKTKVIKRDEARIEKWVEEEWPEIKKKAQNEGREIVFVDEAGFYLLPSVVKTYAPKGETPVLKKAASREHLSVISGITLGGKMYMIIQEESFKGPQIVEFLQHLLRHIEGKILVVWDGAPCHRAIVVKDFLKTEAGKRVWLEKLPAYAPELNPDEGIWNQLKNVELKNLCCQSIAELKRELRKARDRLRQKSRIILGCFKQVGLV